MVGINWSDVVEMISRDLIVEIRSGIEASSVPEISDPWRSLGLAVFKGAGRPWL